MNTAPFYIGQKVVVVESHPDGDIKKGQIYHITSVFTSNCCESWKVTIGLPAKTFEYICSNCGCDIDYFDSESVFKASRFAPVHEGFESISFTKVLEEELVSVN